jgi:hypothetical protein
MMVSQAKTGLRKGIASLRMVKSGMKTYLDKPSTKACISRSVTFHPLPSPIANFHDDSEFLWANFQRPLPVGGDVLRV